MALTLNEYKSGASGPWVKGAAKAAAQLNQFELRTADDQVTLTGPLSVNVSVVLENTLVAVTGGQSRSDPATLYSYDVDVPAGYTWTYKMADLLSQSRGTGYTTIIRPTACAAAPVTQAPDVPCDFAVSNLPNCGEFFPVSCEPCGGGAVRLPPTCGPSLAVTPAPGGCVRPRFFNGMFITREDLDTELRYLRVKRKMTNRVMAGQGGVAWGLGLGRDGSAIVVRPGYAIDCCGNDLVVTSTYRADIPALLSDPAVCNLLTAGPRCMNLLLEYVECPEQPRPVHGDSCSPAATACEMSRVRETVRLRLVPPRDEKPGGPIQRFLDSLANGQAVATPAAPAALNAGGGGSIQVLPEGTPLPFGLTINPPTGGAPMPLALTVGTQASSPRVASDQTIKVGFSITPVAPFAFTGGTVVMTVNSESPGGVPKTLASPPAGGGGPFDFQVATVASPDKLQFNWNAVLQIQNWEGPSGTGAAGTTARGNTKIELTLDPNPDVERLHITVTSTESTITPAPARDFPCLTDPCCPAGKKPLFPVVPPWIHEDPSNPGKAADPEVLALALTYTFLVAGGASDAGTSGLTPAGTKILRAVQGLFGTHLADGADEARQSLQQLLSDWCCALLYPGPACQGDPHGVVIGCAVVAGGTITRVDPWGGRRWVVQYPLLSYWGQQFGVVPPDLLASKVFSIVCCLARPLVRKALTGWAVEEESPKTSPATMYTSESSQIVVGTTEQIMSGSLTGVAPVQVQTVSLPEFAARVVKALAAPAAPPGTPLVAITTAGFPTLHLVTPDAPPATSSLSSSSSSSSSFSSSASPAAATAGATAGGRGESSSSSTGGSPSHRAAGSSIAGGPSPKGDRAATMIRAVLNEPAVRSSVPPLLRGFATKLSERLLGAVPVTALELAPPVVDALAAAGVKTLTGLLALDPAEAHAGPLAGPDPAAVSDAFVRAEARADEVVRGVAGAFHSTGGERRVVHADDLTPAQWRRTFARPLAKKLGLPPEETESAVVESLGKGP